MTEIKKKGSNFLLLRVSAALFVVLGHSTILLGRSEPNFGILGMGVHTFGLYLFFAVSGYLVTQSYRDTKSFGRFLTKRIFRIYPATVAMTLLTFGPIAIIVNSEYDPLQYVNVDGKSIYLLNLLFYPVYFLPGVFPNNPVPNAVNGSLWSLPLEIACYLTLAIVLVILAKFSNRILRNYIPIVTFGSLAFFFSTSHKSFQSGNLTSFVLWGTNWSFGFLLFSTFFLASALNFVSERFIRPSISLVILVLYLLLTSVYSPHPFFLSFVFAYTVVSLGNLTSKFATKLLRFGDPTFGTYLWAYPIQQIMVQIFPSINFILNLFLVVPLSLVCGYVSFHVIEKRFIDLGRNIQFVLVKK